MINIYLAKNFLFYVLHLINYWLYFLNQLLILYKKILLIAGENVLVLAVDGFETKVKLVEETLSFAFLLCYYK